MSAVPSSVQDKQSPYVGYFRGNGIRTHRRLFEPNSHPHVGVYRHSPAKTTSNGLQEILRDKRTSLKPKSVISTLQLFNMGPKHLEKKALELMPTSHFISNRDQCGDSAGETPMCPICLENFVDGDEIRNLKCSHCFHKSCVDIWLLGTMSSDLTTTVCPTCRQDASSVVSEPDTGSSVYSSPEYPAPISTIPAECFLRVGQFLFNEGSRSGDHSNSSSITPANHTTDATPPKTHTPSPPLPLPPIAVSRSPALPPLQCHPSPSLSPSAAAFLLSSGPPSSSTLPSVHSNSSISSSPSPNLPSKPSAMFFPALDDSTYSNSPDIEVIYNTSSETDANDRHSIFLCENEINYHILANEDDDIDMMSCSFMNMDTADDGEE